MDITRRHFGQGAGLALLGSAASSTTWPAMAQQDYPNRAIRSLCNFGPGSGADIVVRFYSDRLSKLSGQPVVVDNKPGAAGNIATQIAATSKPDGYTILITPGNATLASAPHLFKDVAFDPIKSFEPVARLARVPFVMIVKPDSPINNIADLTALLKSKGPKARYGASTNTAVITAELYAQMAGLQIERINYNAVADAMRGLLADEFDFAAYDATWVAGMAQAGRVKPIGVTSTERSSALPKVPTLAESGFPSFNLTPWWGAVVPAGTPKPIVDKLSGWFAEITNSQDTKEFMGKLATETWAGGPDDLRQLIASELEAWGKYIALAKIEKQ
ncbi:MAG TPA: tripartite tricarboxylate transporter substrate binding protein [Beijerinckiaceae bacterium]|jgi:tripartite-type tricarboxylate transporter receptor subunit TctC|nr:tripartite tricarboxylate transporter substrate binding protein [Beijerinckiaceae bacterium]